MNILIAGASGLVGTALTRHLADSGHTVFHLSRGRSHEKNSRMLFWNPAEGKLDLPSEPDFGAVIHLGGANIAAGRWTTRRKAELRDSRIQSTSLLADAICKLPRPPEVFACASAIGIYGDRGSTPLTEDSASADNFMGQLGSDWEAACAPARKSGVRVVNLRFGIALAPAGGALAKMLPAFRFGLGGVIGNGAQYWSWVSLADLVRAIEFCLGHPDISGPINIVSPNPVTNREFTNALGHALHRPTFLPLPALAARLLLGEMADAALLSSARVLPKKLIANGFEFSHPHLPKALSALLCR